ncbi:MAG: dihydroorotase [Candidatus Thiodiazotropha lotti]|nr:dihydroorotase [Candidatus Thiodiazotropha lotti]MCG8001519.1 dihydroorotase [Candidatus Thiodiazotropha lotti]MCW4183898.1 dihydroorotase [Candidatus Thiodiazotropha weberae]MCW4193293.1 dihydroorotase [Candidatus Thiodiazotropha weberae]
MKKKKKDIRIRNGRVVDPGNGIDEVTDLHLSAGKILALGQTPENFQPLLEIDATDQIVCPGLIDLTVNLREPGNEHKATIASETACAARNGITTLCCTPDTLPVIDTPAVVGQIRHKARKAGYCRLLPQGALTKNLDGTHLSEMAALKAAGCIAVTNCYTPLANTLVQRRAMEYASTFNLLTIIRPEDQYLCNNGCAHEGKVADRLGLPGIPEAAETVAVARDLALAETTGAVIHFHALSSASAARTMAWAKREGRKVSADVAIHQLHLTELDLEGFDSNRHVRPPLRTDSDRDGLRKAVAENVIQAICSDHQPHEADAKSSPLPDTEPGISGLDTLLPLTLKLVEQEVMDLSSAIARLTCGPADILGLPLGRLTPGYAADICIYDPNRQWHVSAEQIHSAGKNTPFTGWEMPGRVTHTLLKGRLVFREETL